MGPNRRKCGNLLGVAKIRLSQAAALLGVSVDTVRRWVDRGRLTAVKDAGGRSAVDGAELAAWAHELANAPAGPEHTSARNRMSGLVTEVRSDPVMSQVTLQCGPFRIVSLMSTEAVEDLGLEVGSIATAIVKSTNVILEA